MAVVPHILSIGDICSSIQEDTDCAIMAFFGSEVQGGLSILLKGHTDRRRLARKGTARDSHTSVASYVKRFMCVCMYVCMYVCIATQRCMSVWDVVGYNMYCVYYMVSGVNETMTRVPCHDTAGDIYSSIQEERDYAVVAPEAA